MEMTLGEAFARSARKFPEKVACMDDERSLTYDQLNRRVNRWAHAIRGLGVIKDAHVATLVLFSLRRRLAIDRGPARRLCGGLPR